MSVETAIEVLKTAVVSGAVSGAVLSGFVAAEALLGRSERKQRKERRVAIIAAAESPEAKARELAEEKERAARDLEIEGGFKEIAKLQAQLRNIDHRSAFNNSPRRSLRRRHSGMTCRT